MPVALHPSTAPRIKNVRNPIGPEEYDRLTSQRRYIVNITERSWQVQRTYGVFQIFGCEGEHEYTVLEIRGRVESTDEGNDQALQWKHEAKDIADDIAKEINGYISAAPGAESFMGVFVSEELVPRPKALADAKKRLRGFQTALVTAAKRLWDDPKTHREINELHRWAGRALGVKGDWLMDVEDKATCPACQEQISHNLAKCPKCHAVLDMAKLKEFFPIEYAQIQALREPKPRKSAQVPAE